MEWYTIKEEEAEGKEVKIAIREEGIIITEGALSELFEAIPSDTVQSIRKQNHN